MRRLAGASSPSPSLGGPPTAGRQRVVVGASGGVVASSLDCAWSLAIAEAQRTGAACSRLSPPVLGPRGGWVTPAVHPHGPAPFAATRHNPQVPGSHVVDVHCATEVDGDRRAATTPPARSRKGGNTARRHQDNLQWRQ